MCLLTELKTPLIAGSDIICYKVLKRTPRNKYWHTPFQNYPIKDYRKIIKVSPEAFNNCVKLGIEHKGKIQSEAIHSFALERSAAEISRKLACICPGNVFTVTRAIIPKGTRYYFGRFDGIEDAYASEAIIYEDPDNYICRF